MAEKKQDDMKKEVAKDPAPFIHLEMQEDGSWGVSSNLPNPNRILRIMGAQLVIQNEG